MKERTTIQLPRPIVKRLRKYGSPNSTYAEILTQLMDNKDRAEYVRKMRGVLDDKNRFQDIDEVFGKA